jgi:hypothetical protein
MIMAGTLLLFFFMGILPSGATSTTFLTLILNPISFQSQPFYSQAILAIGAIGSAGALILGFVAGRAKLAAMSIFTIFLLAIGFDFIIIFNQLVSTNPITAVIATLIFSPVFFNWIISVLEWWGVTG